MLDDVLVMVLAGGVGERLYPLTKERAKPAVYFGGPYRIIDFTLSNCINSDIRRIFILTQYKALELIRHLRGGWYFLPSETVMVGDNLDADIRGAKNAGLYAVWISRRAGPSSEDQPRVQPDATVSTLAELPALLDLLQVQ